MFKTKTSLSDKVTERLAAAGDKVLEAIVDARYVKELEKRTVACSKVIENLLGFEAEFSKLNRADIKNFSVDAEGKRTPIEAWTDGRLKQVDKLKQQIEQHEKALTEALEEAKWEKVFNLANGKAPPISDGPDQSEG